MNVKQKTGLILSTLIMIAAIVVIGPMDTFTHGFFSDEIDCEQIAAEDYQDSINLQYGSYEMMFSPQKPHMVGFEIYLVNQPTGNTGRLCLTILNDDGIETDNIYVDLSKVSEAGWYKVYISKELKEGNKYTLRFTAEDCVTVPCLQNVDRSYLPDETITGNILLSYSYAESTFTFQNKIIIVLFIIAIWGFVSASFMEKAKKKIIRAVVFGVFMTAILTWNYMYNSMDNQNSSFSNFSVNADALVTGMIYAQEDGVYFEEKNEDGFGLGKYYSFKGVLTYYGLNYTTNDNWLDGYSRTQGQIVVDSNIYSRKVAVVGNYIAFDNGEIFQIVKIKDNGDYIVIDLNTDSVLTSAKYGSLDDVTVYDKNNQPLARSKVTAYKSQYGLQGKVFRRLAQYMEEEDRLENLHLLCSIATSVVFVLIIFLIASKYNKIMAGCFFVVFWLSPWVVNFARNLYWVEFTWFIPMLIGLFCAWKVNERKYRIISYAGTFVAIFGRALCGYEFISVIMMGLIAFLLVDFAAAVINRNKKQAKLLFRTIFIIGIVAIIGFMAAICVHAPLRGDGSIVKGIADIFKEDVLRRTNGTDLNEFDSVYWPSLNASVWETFCKYFHFNTEVITGITGNLFPLLCVTPLFIFCYEYKRKKLNTELAVMYGVFFLTSVSWFCLAKGHSYIHTHLNYVLWYFGFVQICIYIIVNKIINTIKTVNLKTRGD